MELKQLVYQTWKHLDIVAVLFIPLFLEPLDEVTDVDEDDNEYTLESENIEEHKSLILHLLSKLKLGMDLTKVSDADYLPIRTHSLALWKMCVQYC